MGKRINSQSVIDRMRERVPPQLLGQYFEESFPWIMVVCQSKDRTIVDRSLGMSGVILFIYRMKIVKL